MVHWSTVTKLLPIHNKYFATLAQDKLAANTKNGNAAFINNNPLHFLFSAIISLP